jgi:hypothetical protein
MWIWNKNRLKKNEQNQPIFNTPALPLALIIHTEGAYRDLFQSSRVPEFKISPNGAELI